MSEVSLLLKMLDQENLSSSTEEKKTSVWKLLQQIQSSGEDARIKDEGTFWFLHMIKMQKILILGVCFFNQIVHE